MVDGRGRRRPGQVQTDSSYEGSSSFFWATEGRAPGASPSFVGKRPKTLFYRVGTMDLYSTLGSSHMPTPVPEASLTDSRDKKS